MVTKRRVKTQENYLFSSQQWQRLVPSSAECNDHHELELSGVGNYHLVQVLTDLVRSKGPTVLFLMETKLSIQELDPIKTEIGFNSTLAVPSIRRSGGITLLWKDSVMVDPQTFSLNDIDVYIFVPMQEQW